MKDMQRSPVNEPNAGKAGTFGAFQRHHPGLCPLLGIYHQTQAPGSSVYPDVLLHCLDDGPQLLRNKDIRFLLRNISSLFDPEMARGF